MASDTEQWFDATPFLEHVCSDMALGELIHGENFSLFEAMSALEIMDPKMDAGMTTSGFRNAEEAIAAGVAPVDLSVPQLLDVMDHLMACEATWHDGNSLAQTVFTCIYLLDVDRTAANPMLHAYCRAVRATCNIIRTLACRADAREEEDFVTASFGLPLEGDVDSKSLAPLLAVEEMVARRLKLVKGSPIKKKSGEDAMETPAFQDDPTMDAETCRALLCRIRFRKALVYAMTNMEKPRGKGLELAKKHLAAAQTELSLIRASTNHSDFPVTTDSTSVPTFPSPASPALTTSMPANLSSPSSFESETPSTAELETSIQSSDPKYFPTIAPPPTESQSNGKHFPLQAGLDGPQKQPLSSQDPVSEPRIHLRESDIHPMVSQTVLEKEGRTLDSDAVSTASQVYGGALSTASGRKALGFDEMVNRSLLAPTPPRPMRILSWLEALDKFEKLVLDLQRVSCCPLSSPLNDLQRYLIDFQEYRPGPVVRCHLQQLLMQWGQPSQEEKAGGHESSASPVIFQTLQLPYEGQLLNDGPLRWFTIKAKQLELRLLRALCGNLSRQRREMAKLLSDWDVLIQEAEQAGASPALRAFATANYPQGWWTESLLISWCGEQACRIIWHYLLLGFNTKLYATSEFCNIFWYLDHVLSTLIHNVEARERAWWERRQNSASDSGKDKGNRRKKGLKDRVLPFKGSADLMHIRCQADLCKAFVRMLVAFTEDKKLLISDTPFNSQQERFEQRMEVLGRVHIPDPMTYNAFRRGTDISDLTVTEVYQMSHELFQSTAANVQQLKELVKQEAMADLSKEQRFSDIQHMGQVATRNCMALQVAHRAGRGASLKVSFDFSVHPCFPVAVLKRS